jgi:hypothetical protein
MGEKREHGLKRKRKMCRTKKARREPLDGDNAKSDVLLLSNDDGGSPRD